MGEMWRRARCLALASALGMAPALQGCGDGKTSTDVDDVGADGESDGSADGATGDGSIADGEPGDGAESDGSADGSPDGSTGDGAADGSTGDGAADGSAGDGAADGSTGDGADGSVGDGAADGSTGDGAADGSTGDGAADGSTGDGAADGSTGDGAADGSAGDGDSGLDGGVALPDAGEGVDAGSDADGGSDLDAGTDLDGGAPPVCEAPDPNLPPAGANQALGGAVLTFQTNCNSPVAEAPAKLFDDLDTTKFLCFQPRPSIGIAFANLGRYAIKTYTLTSGNDAPERDPKDWRLEGTDDGVTWTSVDERSGELFAQRAQTRRFDVANCAAFQRYRLVVVQNNGATIFQLAELRLYGDVDAGPQDLALGGTVTSSCPNAAAAEDSPRAFDGNITTKWFCGANKTPSVEVALAGGPRKVTSYAITSGNDLPDRDPASWVIEGSDDGASWEPLDPAQTGQAFSARSQTLAYPLDNDRAFGFYRLRVTANGGSNDFQVAEIALFGE